MSKFLDKLDYEKLNTRIPSSLRHVAPFLEEAMHTLREQLQYAVWTHAFNMLNKFDFELDAAAVACLEIFESLRADSADYLVKSGDTVPQLVLSSSDAGAAATGEDILLAEANSTLELAEQQYDMNLPREAARNYHTATIYYRVIDSSVHLDAEHQAKMEYSACRTRQCSHLLENFVLEHFSGVRCVDVYEIDSKQLGHGAYGSVHLCKHRKSGDVFACKLISLTRISSHYLRKLHLEIAIMKEVDHPNIVKLKEVFFGSKTVYLVMELCEGGELFDQVTQSSRRGFPEPHAAKLMRDMISSVKYLHDHSIVHRDIKLENFLFEKAGSLAGLKLIDFGLSKHFDEHESMRQVVGSAYYTAPEVLLGSYDHRCHIWSLGVIAYMLLCGSPPFHGSKNQDIHSMILKEELNLSPVRFPRTSPEAFNFLRKMLVKDPAGRMSLADALNHPFIQMANKFSEAETHHEVSTEVVQSVTHFLKLSKIKKLMLKVVAFTLNPKQIEQLRDDFYSIDSDRNGTISMKELKKALSGTNQSASEIEISFKALEEAGLADSDINYSEFLAAAMLKRININEERLELAFETLDSEGSGFVDVSALRTSLGTEQSAELLDDLLSELDTNNDGRIDYKEFLAYWKSLERAEKLTPLQRFAMSVKKVKAINGFKM